MKHKAATKQSSAFLAMPFPNTDQLACAHVTPAYSPLAPQRWHGIDLHMSWNRLSRRGFIFWYTARRRYYGLLSLIL